MENSSEPNNLYTRYIQKFNLYHFFKVCTYLGLIGVLFFVLLIGCKFVLSVFPPPYNYFFVGIGVCLFIFTVAKIAGNKTYLPRSAPYDTTKLSTRDSELLNKLMESLQAEINRFQNTASYFFNSVRSFKYSTVVLASISTVILGLDITGVEWKFPIAYTVVVKDIALVIGAIIAVLNTMAIYWNLEKYWLQNKIILQRFRQLQEEIELADKKNPLSAQEVADYSEQFKKIKFDFYKYWEGVQAERNKA